jgi:NAD(P)-dependent dehydrogenase (short-subunit alcohol dehydrogenase family)
MNLALDKKHILVTGATGGIGEKIISQLIDERANISAQFHKNSKKAQNLENLYKRNQIQFIKADLRIESDVKNLFKEAISKFGRVDALIANAGIWPQADLLTADLSLEQWTNTITVNLTGVFLCVKEFFKNLKQNPDDEASVILIGSTAGCFGEAGHADYSASKAALMYGLTKTWKNEIIHFAPLGRVNTVAPGWVLTEMAEESLQDEEFVKSVLQTMPLKKVAKAEDVVNVALFLLSNKTAGHITGETIFVHGGMEGRVLSNHEDVDLSFFRNIKNEKK